MANLSVHKVRDLIDEFKHRGSEMAAPFEGVTWVEEAPGGEESSENLDLVHQLLSCAEALDAEGISSHMAPDCAYRNMPLPAFTWASDRRGSVKQLKVLTRIVKSYTVTKYHRALSAGNLVLIDRSERLRLPVVSIDLRVTALFECRDGKVSSWNDDFRLRDLLKRV